MADAIYQSRLVVHFFVQHTGKIGVYLVHTGPVADVLLQVVEHVGDLDIGSAMKRAFQRADARSYGRVSVRTGGGSDTYRKRRVVTAAMFRLQHQQQVEGAGIQFRIVLLQHIEEILCKRKILLRMTDMQ